MNVLHPMSSMTVARLAARLIDDQSWTHIGRVEVRETVARMERAAQFGPAPDSPGARILAASATRISALACDAFEAGDFRDVRKDLSWLWEPARMDAAHRRAFAY